MLIEGKAELPVSLGEAQAYVRIETGEEEALLAGMMRAASAICEQFIGQWLMQRSFAQRLAPNGEWQRLGVTPVASISGVEAVADNGTKSLLPASDYAVDIDASGDGWVRVQTSSAKWIDVSGTAGMAAGRNDLPEPLRFGLVRLVAHLFAHRDGDAGEPPAAVSALWRPYRRIRL